jgi:hypothetical protein
MVYIFLMCCSVVKVFLNIGLYYEPFTVVSYDCNKHQKGGNLNGNVWVGLVLEFVKWIRSYARIIFLLSFACQGGGGSQWGSVTHQMAVPGPSKSCVLNHHNLTMHIRHQCRKTTFLSCHRCLIKTGVEKWTTFEYVFERWPPDVSE